VTGGFGRPRLSAAEASGELLALRRGVPGALGACVLCRAGWTMHAQPGPEPSPCPLVSAAETSGCSPKPRSAHWVSLIHFATQYPVHALVESLGQ
jgi:hypothetical protein